MITKECKTIEVTTSPGQGSNCVEPATTPTYGEIVDAVEKDPTLTPKVRANVVAAVRRAARLVSNTGVAITVDIPRLAEVLERQTPAKTGFANPASMSAFQSNLRRGLQIGGIRVMPGRHRAPLSPEWKELLERLPDTQQQSALARLAHVASSRGWTPATVGESEFEEFKRIVGETCIKSKQKKMVRNTIAAWRKAQQQVPEWPTRPLEVVRPPSRNYTLPWSAFPESLRVEIDAFVDRGDLGSALDFDDEARPIRQVTAENYRSGLRRAASILVVAGGGPESIKSIRDLLHPVAVRTIYGFLCQRTGKNRGGHPGQMMHLLLHAAQKTPGIDDAWKKYLERAWKRTRPEQAAMAPKTFARLLQFDDPDHLNALLTLPRAVLDRLHGPAERHPSRRAVRSALLLSLLIDTAFRSGNVYGLDLDRHFVQLDFSRRAPEAIIQIPETEVKNGQPLSARLTPVTVRLLQIWIQEFRPTVSAVANSWLFPRKDGSRMNGTQVWEDVSDLVAREIGFDIHPHLIRAVAGKILLDAMPGAYAEAQTLLGHRTMQTTVAFYTPVRQEQVRQRYQDTLRRGSGTEVL